MLFWVLVITVLALYYFVMEGEPEPETARSAGPVPEACDVSNGAFDRNACTMWWQNQFNEGGP